ncbi:MAG: YbaB/EbfC family nucleoid-associated protein [Dehalococcoidia bacterium]|nr:YbaB/EbfC family nucleoid-associated protein [Dehalococcoidia bacterium]
MANRGGMNQGELMKQIQAMQAKLAQAQQKLEETVIEASAGGGAVAVTMNARPELKSITVQAEVVDPDDVEMLQDLIMAAMNEALEKVRAGQMQQLAGLAGGLNIPGLTG